MKFMLHLLNEFSDFVQRLERADDYDFSQTWNFDASLEDGEGGEIIMSIQTELSDESFLDKLNEKLANLNVVFYHGLASNGKERFGNIEGERSKPCPFPRPGNQDDCLVKDEGIHCRATAYDVECQGYRS